MQGEPTPYSHEDRLQQLQALATASEAAAGLFLEYGPTDLGKVFASLAEGAKRLRVEGFADADLHALGLAVPERLPWMHPKDLDYTSPRQVWQEAAAESVERVERAALDLRTVAVYDG